MTYIDYTLLEEDLLIKRSMPVEKSSGVYFLIKDKEIAYIGSSRNLFHRIGGYLGGLKKEKNFDRFYFIEAEKSEIEILEAKYILKFLPKQNNLSKEMLCRYESIACFSNHSSNEDIPF